MTQERTTPIEIGTIEGQSVAMSRLAPRHAATATHRRPATEERLDHIAAEAAA